MIVIDKKVICRIILLTLIAATLVFIWSNSLADAKESTEMSNTVVDKVKPIIDPKDKISDDTFVTIVRKAAHFTEFAALGAESVLLMCTYDDHKKRTINPLLITISGCFLCAVIDELLQLTSPGRSCEYRDMMIDLGGIITGAIIILLIRKLIVWIIHRRSKIYSNE